MITCAFENKAKACLRHVVVDMLVIKENQILLVKRGPQYLEPDKWALPGGFVERDETCTQAALRETLEETGYQGKVIKLFRIVDNPDRPHEDRQNISLIYLIKPIKKVKKHDKEVSETKWFDLDKLPPSKDIAFDHLESINQYKSSLIKADKLDSWRETHEIMADKKLVKELKQSEADFKAGNFVTEEQLLKELNIDTKNL